MAKIKVLIVDDSAIVRNVLAESLSALDDIEVIGAAPDPYIARDKIVKLNPDVITLDIEMPRMDGLTFLQKLMHYYPVPTIVVSSVTAKDSFAAIKALEVGAFDVVNKPGGSITVEEVVGDVAFKIREAYKVKEGFLDKMKKLRKPLPEKKGSANVAPQIKTATNSNILKSIETTDKLIVIGASTGGTVALEFIMRQLPSNLPPILIAQHMPVGFTAQFASRLNELAQLHVKESEDNEIIVPGTVYVAKGGVHLTISRRGANIYTRFKDSERVHFQKPAADVLFSSTAEVAGRNVLGILLTGMGRDGADGLLEMKKAGAMTVAQDEKSSIVWGMPKAAIDLDAAKKIASLDDVPTIIKRYAES